MRLKTPLLNEKGEVVRTDFRVVVIDTLGVKLYFLERKYLCLFWLRQAGVAEGMDSIRRFMQKNNIDACLAVTKRTRF